jgi:hypothetical protein
VEFSGFTLERMAKDLARYFQLYGQIEKITVRVQKPSALSFARSSGVEITREVTDFQVSRVLTYASMQLIVRCAA